jgi:murein L,D-transpeptidase YcbB/YkuD
VDDNGQMNFRDDIYGHDTRLAGKMFGATNNFASTGH